MHRRELLKATAVGTGLWVAGPCGTRAAESVETRVETDVLVIGGGTAGTVAAIQAGRAGVRTMLVALHPHAARLRADPARADDDREAVRNT